jgi:hypothetical protein
MRNRPDPDRAAARVMALRDALLSIVHGFDFQASPFFHGRGNNSQNFVGLGALLLIGHPDNSMECGPGPPYDAGNGKNKATEQFHPER